MHRLKKWSFAVLAFLVLLGSAIKWLSRLSLDFAKSYLRAVDEYTAEDGAGFRRKFLESEWSRKAFRGVLYLFAPLFLLALPLVFAVVTARVLIAIDQATIPNFSVDDRFVEIAGAVDGEQVEVSQIGSALFTATYHQLERELKTPIIGWTANDVFGMQAWDNRVNRQLGVIHGSRELFSVLSIAITRLGSRDEEDSRFVTVRQSKFTQPGDQWFIPTPAEWAYRAGIGSIKSYQDDLLNGRVDHANINITNKDIETILKAISDNVLDLPHSRLNKRSDEVSWFDIDNRVFFAKGSAIVARDALVVLRYAYEHKIREAGALDNMDQAISSLEGAIEFQPWVTLRGAGDSIFGDHRSKMSRYYTDARERIRDVADAINR